MSYQLALSIAKIAHSGQLDKGGNPYIEHPLYVASQFEEEELKIVAVLHDIIEDSHFELSDISTYFDCDIIGALYAITKQNSENYDAYLDRVKSNLWAKQVKMEDLKHNMDLSRIKKVQKKDLERVEKYRKALEFLEM